MRTLEECRRKAQECRVKAFRARDLEAKAIYESMARQWEEMVDQIEQRRLKSLNAAYRASLDAAGGGRSSVTADWRAYCAVSDNRNATCSAALTQGRPG